MVLWSIYFGVARLGRFGTAAQLDPVYGGVTIPAAGSMIPRYRYACRKSVKIPAQSTDCGAGLVSAAKFLHDADVLLRIFSNHAGAGFAGGFRIDQVAANTQGKRACGEKFLCGGERNASGGDELNLGKRPLQRL